MKDIFVGSFLKAMYNVVGVSIVKRTHYTMTGQYKNSEEVRESTREPARSHISRCYLNSQASTSLNNKVDQKT
jgi:hypothetical protein